MNWDQIEGAWNEKLGQAREMWGRLTDDELQQVRGKRDQLAGLVQKKYGLAKEEAERQVDEFADSLDRH